MAELVLATVMWPASDPVTVTVIRCRTSPGTSWYAVPVAPAIGTPLRFHWTRSDTPFGRQLPTLTVTTEPTRLPPLMLGRGVERGARFQRVWSTDSKDDVSSSS
jgi:hypothetical protein